MSFKHSPLRADAERNRRRLLEAASELFAEKGLKVTLNDIAHHAGVGVGTAYRRFANKDEVINALFDERFDEVYRTASQALQDPDPWHALCVFLEHSLQMQFEDRGLKDIVAYPGLTPERYAKSHEQLSPLIDAIAERAREQGTLRQGITGADLILLQIGLIAVMDLSRKESPNLYRRYLTIVLDGLRSDCASTPTLAVSSPSNLETSSMISLNNELEHTTSE